MFAAISHKWRAVQSNRFYQNMGWLAGAEVVSRVGRIVAAIALARTLNAIEFGLAALALTIFELVRLFTENGVGAAVIRAGKERVSASANTAYYIMWGVCLGLVAIQLAIAAYVTWGLNTPQTGAMIAVLSLVFLVMPFGVVHGFILQRDQRFKRLACVASAQTTTDHLLTAALALTGFGAWAIVLPKVLTTPIWLIGVTGGSPWKRDRAAGFVSAKAMSAFAVPVLLAEMATACRDNLDKLIVSVLLGLEALGIFYFAFNAGLGLSTAVNRAVNSALYPYLCKVAEVKEALLERFDRILLQAGPFLALIYIAQAGAALIYVPLLFGQDWAFAATLVAIFCLGGPARLAVDAARVLNRASGRSDREMGLSLAFMVCTLSGLAAGTPLGLWPAAITMTVTASLGGLALLLLARHQLRRAEALSPTEGVPA